jgi:hypothetical protein
MRPLLAGILTAIVAGLLAACAHAPNATQRNLAWLAEAANQAPGDVGRECIDSALQTSYALVAFQRARSSDAEVQASLVNNVSLKQLRAQRLQEAEIWAYSHDPAQVSANHLTWCLAQDGLSVAENAVLLDCLRSTEPAAFLSVARRTGEPQARAVDAMDAFYAAKAPSEPSESLADAVYGAPTDHDDLKLRASLFSNCVARPLRDFGLPQTG